MDDNYSAVTPALHRRRLRAVQVLRGAPSPSAPPLRGQGVRRSNIFVSDKDGAVLPSQPPLANMAVRAGDCFARPVRRTAAGARLAKALATSLSRTKTVQCSRDAG